VDLISGPVIIDNRKTVATVVAVAQEQATAEEATVAEGKSNVFDNLAQSFPMANSFNLTYLYIYIYIYVIFSCNSEQLWRRRLRWWRRVS
jgi:hypothetical protein